ncbi:MAG: sterol desaturase family protein [Actinobacteria bacterium]|nr:sterol desaturase family protein [Actinomycetota bacterium]
MTTDSAVESKSQLSPWRRSFYSTPGHRRSTGQVLPGGPRTTLRQAAVVWVSMPSVQLFLTAWLVALVARVWVGGYTWWDLVIVAVMVGFQPMTEWLIHTYVLHARPRRIGKREYSTLLAREHYRHHADPKELETIFIPLPVAVGMVTLPWLLLLIPGWYAGLVLTGILTGLTLATVYEWTHYLIHTPYKPRHALYRGIRRGHVLHHYRNENYWMGVTNHLADRVLHTYPKKDEVPASPTAKDLAAR